MPRVVEVITAKRIKLRDKPCLGPWAEKSLLDIGGIIRLDWEGHPELVRPTETLDELADSWFELNDKASAGFVAFSPKYEILYSAGLFPGNPDADDPEERGPHYWFDDPKSFAY